MKRRIIFLGLMFITGEIWSQTVKIDAEIRSRGEYRQGFREPLADSLNINFVNNLRTKINVFYSYDKIDAKISLFDSRSYGMTPLNRTGNGVGILEAWGVYRFTPNLSFTLGRQSLGYDDQHIFSFHNWSNTPASHDLLLFKYNTPNLIIHAGSAYNNAGDSIQFLAPYKLTYKTLNFFWISKVFGKISSSATWVNDSYEQGTVGNIFRSYRNTIAANIWITNKENPFYFKINGHYQFGKDNFNRGLRAFLFTAKLEQQISPKIRAYAGGELFSGSDNNLSSDKNNTFNKINSKNYTSLHGNMEYWNNVPTQGMIDIYSGVSFSFTSKLVADFVFHNYSTHKEIKTGINKNIGSEIDLTLNYTINSILDIHCGWSTYFTTKGTDILKNKTGIGTYFPQWAYVQILFKPVFFSNP